MSVSDICWVRVARSVGVAECDRFLQRDSSRRRHVRLDGSALFPGIPTGWIQRASLLRWPDCVLAVHGWGLRLECTFCRRACCIQGDCAGFCLDSNFIMPGRCIQFVVVIVVKGRSLHCFSLRIIALDPLVRAERTRLVRGSFTHILAAGETCSAKYMVSDILVPSSAIRRTSPACFLPSRRLLFGERGIGECLFLRDLLDFV